MTAPDFQLDPRLVRRRAGRAAAGYGKVDTLAREVSRRMGERLDYIRITPTRILDLGCGPGRDLKAFTAMGHHATGVDGCPRFVEMARAYSGCTVWQQDFVDLDLPAAHFDGVFANAVLFHVPSAALPGVLRALYACLKPGGVLFSSNPRGQNEEGWNGARYGSYHDEASWAAYVQAAGFTLVEQYYRPPGLPREQQPWLATVWRKPA